MRLATSLDACSEEMAKSGTYCKHYLKARRAPAKSPFVAPLAPSANIFYSVYREMVTYGWSMNLIW